jgi:phage gp29-like protein
MRRIATTPPAPLRELPVSNWGEWDSVGRVRAAIRSLEQGMFDQGACLCDAMTRDDRVGGALLTRTQALPSLPFTLEAGKGARAEAIARDFEARELFSVMCPDSALIELQHWAQLIGVGLGENVWELNGQEWVPRLRVWHPRWLSWRDDPQGWWVQTRTGPVQVVPNNGQWVMLAPLGLHRAWMHGLVRSLYVPWLVRQWGLRDWARHSEVLGTPIKKAYTPTSADEEDKQRFLREVAGMGAESVVRIPRGDDVTSPGFELELLEASGSNGDGFDRLVTKASECLTIRILGQNLTSEVKGGSFAAAKVHANIRADVLQADAEALVPCLRQQVLGWWSYFNHGDPELAPIPGWNVEPPEDKGEGAKSIFALGQAIEQLRKVGAQPDVDAMLERAGVPVTGPAQEPPPQPAPDLPRGQNGALPRVGAPDRRALASQRAPEAPTEAELEGQQYTDAVAEQLAGQGNAAVSPMLGQLLDCVMNSQSFDELEQRVVAAFPKMDVSELADIQQKAYILAELSGRLAIAEEFEE